MLLRHAKSDWENNDIGDIDRPLKFRGICDAYNLGRRLLDHDLKPDGILSSSAERALHTAVIVSRAMGLSTRTISIESSLYEASPGRLLMEIGKVPDTVSSLMVVGHNPELESLSGKLSRGEVSTLPTCGLVVVNFGSMTWNEVEEGGEATLELYDFPKLGMKSVSSFIKS